MKTTVLFALAMAIFLTDGLAFAQDTTLTISSAGNVGIGTTTPGSGTNSKFDVVGKVSFRPIGANTDKVLNFDDISGALRIYTDALTGTPGDLILGTYPNGHINQLVLQQSTGNVGIGIATPGSGTNSKFDVVGKVSFRPISANTDKVLIFDDISGALRIYTDALTGTPGNLILGTYPNGHANQLVLQQSTGNVGIGTATPDQLLSVNGDASKVGGGTWATFSDKRLKQDINSFTDGLAVLKGIRPVTFRYNGKLGYPTHKSYVGVLAQEMQSVAPYTIDTYRTKLNPDDREEADVLRFDGTALTYIAINAIKELDAKVEEIRTLQMENRNLSERLAGLEALVKSLAAENSGGEGKSVTELR